LDAVPIIGGASFGKYVCQNYLCCNTTTGQGKGGRRRGRRRESKGTLNESKPFIHSSMGLCLSFLFFSLLLGPTKAQALCVMSRLDTIRKPGKRQREREREREREKISSRL
jgi:hypothetical protein